MKPQFLVLSLPRSRSAWLSRFLSYGGRNCGHDLAPGCGSIAQFQSIFSKFGGSCETGAMLAHKILGAELPHTKFVTIRRPVEDVIGSLAKFGLRFDEELRRRDAMLDEFEKNYGARRYQYADLDKQEVCKDLFEYCLGQPFDPAWWLMLRGLNIQVNMAEWLQFLEANRPNIERFKEEVAIKSSAGVLLSAESIRSAWPEVNELATQHFEEVDGGVEPKRPYLLDLDQVCRMEDAGMFKGWTLRVDGKLGGYCTWNVYFDPESMGLLVATQGAWFMRKECKGLGTKLFEFSLEGLKALGVKNVFPHYRLQGRGDRLGKYFSRLGAKEIQHTYSLWIGD